MRSFRRRHKGKNGESRQYLRCGSCICLALYLICPNFGGEIQGYFIHVDIKPKYRSLEKTSLGTDV